MQTTDSTEASENRALWLNEVAQAASLVLQQTERLQFQSYLVGVAGAASDRPRARFIKRALGIQLYETWQAQKQIDFETPDLIFEVHAATELQPLRVTIHRRAVFLYGRYRKLARGLSQCRWFAARQPGQKRARIAAASVQELIGIPARESFDCPRLPLLHGMGREDVDVLMLGLGRPFVLELPEPRLRQLDANALSAEIRERSAGQVEVSQLQLTNHRAPALVKALHPDKSYRATCVYEGPKPSTAELESALTALFEKPLEQRTPQRVAQRRADLIRPRSIRWATLTAEDDRSFTIDLRSESGTYIKEMISGDGGRTSPSLSALLARPCRCLTLDVLEIHCSDEQALRLHEPPADMLRPDQEPD